MKKSILFLSVLMCCLSICACGKSKPRKTISEKSTIFSYDIKNPISFEISGSNIWAVSRGSCKAVLYDDSGEKIREAYLGKGEHTNLCLLNNKMVYFSFYDKGPAVTELDLASNKRTVYYLPKDITSALSMAVTENEIYIIYWKYNEHMDTENEETQSDFVSFGETAAVIDRKTHKTRKMNIKNAMSLYKISGSKIMYFVYDTNKGYCYTIYDTDKKTFSEKVPAGIKQYIFAFAYDKKDHYFITTSGSRRRLTAVDISGKKKKEVQIADDINAVTGNDIKYSKGNCYVLDDISKKIIRVSLKEAINGKKNQTLKLYRTMNMSDPYGCGYFIKTRTLDDEQFALSVMAGDKDYDLCMVNTDESKAKEIRDKGAFYPLDDVPGVSEYLNDCQDYVRKMACDSGGNVWMIPVDVDIPFLLYNENNISDVNSLENLFETADELYKDQNKREFYSLNGYQLQDYMLNAYNSSHEKDGRIKYDTDSFKSICELMKEHPADTDKSLHTWIRETSGYEKDMKKYYNKYIISLSHYYDLSIYNKDMFKSLRAMPVPSVSKEASRNYGSCICLCVNPSSAHLNETLDYISSFCSYMRKRKDILFFKNTDELEFPKSRLAEDLYEIYKNGDLYFNFPDEILWNTYFKYQKGSIGFNDMASELERKVDVYLNE